MGEITGIPAWGTKVQNNGRAVERAILVVGFMLQIGALVLSYGMLKQQVTDLSARVDHIEKFVDGQLLDHMKR